MRSHEFTHRFDGVPEVELMPDQTTRPELKGDRCRCGSARLAGRPMCRRCEDQISLCWLFARHAA